MRGYQDRVKKPTFLEVDILDVDILEVDIAT
jgi:hypothetical protein